MGLKRKEILARKKTSLEQELKARLSALSKKGLESRKVDKDPLVRELKADVRAVTKRLKAIAKSDTRTDELKKIKADRLSAPRQEPAGGKGEKPKKPAAEGKAKKEKPESPKKKPEEPKEKLEGQA